MRFAKLLAVPAIAAIGFFGLAAPAMASTGSVQPICHQGDHQCDPHQGDHGGNGDHNGNHDGHGDHGDHNGDHNHGSHCVTWQPQWDSGFQQYTHQKSCCTVKQVWVRVPVRHHGHHKSWEWVRETVRTCQGHDGHGGNGDHGNNGDHDGQGGGNHDGHGDHNGNGNHGDDHGDGGHGNSGGNHLTSCFPQNFTATVHGGIFTETPGGPVLTPNETILDGGHLYHVTSLHSSGGTVTFQLPGDTGSDGQLRTVCSAPVV